ncbi:MAG: hypothetical protein P8Z68_01645, partial [Kineosporiaceae bacterium]
MSALPPADPLLVADTLAALPVRLRGRLDAAVAKAPTWQVEDGVVRLPGGVEVHLDRRDGVLRDADQVRCGCLLAPACLHRAAVLSAAPVADADPAGDGDPAADAAPVADADPAADGGLAVGGGPVHGDGPVRDGSLAAPATGTAVPGTGPGPGGDGNAPNVRGADPDLPSAPRTAIPGGWTPTERDAAGAVADAAATVLRVGVPGAGAVVQADLLRAVHHARGVGLHRLAAAATRVVTGIRAGRGDDPGYTLRGLTADLVEVFETAHAVRSGADPSVWRGRARSDYAPVGALRLTGVCCEPVLTDS